MSTEMNFDDLPDGWECVDLKNIVSKLVDGSHNPPKKQPSGQPMLSARNIDKNQIIFDTYRFIADEDFERENARTKVTPGDVLLTIVGTIGRTAVVPKGLDNFTLQRSVAVLTPDGVLPKFLMYQLEAPSVQRYFEENARGTAQKGVYLKTLGQTPIKVAPLEQQKRIVAEIEKQFSRLDEAVANLKRVKANLKRYKAAVLKAAVEGKLTEEWRKQHPDVEPADKLLERILAERREKWTRKGKYTEPVVPDTGNLPELPEGWVWVQYDHVGVMQLGRQRSPKYHAGSNMRSYLRVANVFEDRIDISDVKEMDFPQDDYEKYKLEPGDLLLNEGQSPEFLGRPAIYRGELPGACFTNTLIRFRAVEGVCVEFALIVSRHNMHAGRFVEEGTITTNIAHLSLGRLASVEFPLPPRDEQTRIVDEVERQLSIVSGAEAQVEANLRRADRLRQSILKQAFSGQLVPQDPNDESASVLLERIRATQLAQTKEPAAHQRMQRTPAPKTGASSPEPLPLVADAPATYGDAIIARILAAMQPGREYARAEFVDPLGLTTGQWNAAIQELKRVGKVRQVGAKRGTKYELIYSKMEIRPK